MANPDFQPYLAKAWTAYQAAKQSNDDPLKGIMMHEVSWVNQIHPPNVPDSTRFNPPSTSMPSLAVPNANICSSHTTCYVKAWFLALHRMPGVSLKVISGRICVESVVPVIFDMQGVSLRNLLPDMVRAE